MGVGGGVMGRWKYNFYTALGCIYSGLRSRLNNVLAHANNSFNKDSKPYRIFERQNLTWLG